MATKVKTAPKPVAKVKPESIVNDAARTLSDADWPVGSVAHQGDIVLIRITAMPGGKMRANRQMADGNTQGSRHILAGGKAFDCEANAVAKAIKSVCPKINDIGQQYIGPVFVTDEATALRHPEHGDHCYGESGMVVAVVYQRNLDAEMRERRVVD
jgi:hypothetical protein